MKKIVIAVMVVVVLMLALAVPVFADPGGPGTGAPGALGALRHSQAPGQEGGLEPGRLGQYIKSIGPDGLHTEKVPYLPATPAGPQ